MFSCFFFMCMKIYSNAKNKPPKSEYEKVESESDSKSTLKRKNSKRQTSKSFSRHIPSKAEPEWGGEWIQRVWGGKTQMFFFSIWKWIFARTLLDEILCRLFYRTKSDRKKHFSVHFSYICNPRFYKRHIIKRPVAFFKLLLDFIWN